MSLIVIDVVEELTRASIRTDYKDFNRHHKLIKIGLNRFVINDL